MDKPVPILMYHQISPTAPDAFRKYTVTPKAFAAQMAWLARAGYAPITMDALVAARIGTQKFPPRPVVITFDDGFRDCIAYAAPILKQYNFTATFYLVADLIGKTSGWLRAERGVEFALADVNAIRELCAAGFSCGAHSCTHPRLADIPEAQCRRELRNAREKLEEILERPVHHFAYPFGSNNLYVRQWAAEAGYLTACSVEIGLSTARDSFLALRRVPVTGFDSMLDFICRVRTGVTVNDFLHDRVRHWQQQARGFAITKA